MLNLRKWLLGVVVVGIVASCGGYVGGRSDESPLDMSTPISPATPPTISTTIPVPENGTPANQASLILFVQPIEDSLESFRQLTYGGGLRRRVSCTSNTVMSVQPLGAVVVLSSMGVWTVLYDNSGATTLNPTTLTGGLGASQRYFVYSYENSGVLAYTASTTGPDSGLRYKNGDEHYFFVTTFITDGSSNVVLYTQDDNKFTYLEYGTGNRILNIGAATVSTPVAFGYAVPTGASAVTLRTSWASTVATNIQVRTTSGSSIIFIAQTDTSGDESLGFFPVSTAAGNTVNYLNGNAAATQTIHVVDFTY